MSEKIDKSLLPPDLYSRNTVIGLIATLLSGRKTKPGFLDVGGYGGRLDEFLPPEAKYTILDTKPAPVDLGNISYKQGSVIKIPFSDRNFDIVIASDMIEHLASKDRLQAIREMIRVSKNYLIIGVPLANEQTVSAEHHIRSQFLANAGLDHPFLVEHAEKGLPEEEEIDGILTKTGVQYMKVREGNLMNWYIQQLYCGVQWGEVEHEEHSGMYAFYNAHLSELGVLRTPTYRTIYVLSRNNNLPTDEIDELLKSKFGWKTETFMSLIHIVFDDIRNLLNTKKDHLLKLEKNLLEKEVKLDNLSRHHEVMIGRARKSIEAHREAIAEMRNFLQEKEAALQFMKSIIQEKDYQLATIKNELNNLQSFVDVLNNQIAEKQSCLEKMVTHISAVEQKMQLQSDQLKSKQEELDATKRDLQAHSTELKKVISSRAWRAVLFYGSIKNRIIIRPLKLIRRGLEVLFHMGATEFWRRLMRKFSSSSIDAFSGYELYISRNFITQELSKRLKKESEKFAYKPLISIIMPVYNVDARWLKRAINSVINQIYDKWELCICDDASTAPHIRSILTDYAKKDNRIKITYRQKNGGIVKASNDALKIASGAYIGLLDNDDELTADALFEVVKTLQEKRYDLIYSDEDKLEMTGQRVEPFFKPDWSPDLLLGCNYICHFSVFRHRILKEIGGFREGFDGSQDYDLVLRFTEETGQIKHIPKVLYHWRKIPGSTAEKNNAKLYVFEASKRALTDALRRRKIAGEVTDGIWLGSYRVKYKIEGQPLISIIIPFKDKKDILDACIHSIEAKTTYPNFEIILVNNRSELFETAEYLEKISLNSRIRILSYDKPFNFSAINNFASKYAKGEYLLFLNNDTEVLSGDWIESMLEHAQRPRVGAVGAKLLYPNNTIQHAGVVIGLGGLAGHPFSRNPNLDHGYFGMIDIIKNYSAVTAACMMMKKELFESIGGFEEDHLAVAFNDVELCLRLTESGYRIIYTPYALLYHHESISRGYSVNIHEVTYVQRKHASFLKKGDPYYNPNLTLERGDFSLRIQDKIPD